ncbi:biotin--[acetyl-CoA-carboxylase] ligase [Flavobacterium coralii]|uniref:biotin--[acetyl-CoA-carboxylase] ligase n=1 Tax=Flavobacterium coralii TaxID=2838017 RepID=UPI000C464957|nr:biotin--[acetyl-CoA-carboxylase] ligase [Flavobacterium sp.]|tara:strand:- start:5956 stop:6684 length:729 start_codon:yes stop_codon:yes gene_type:complete
MNIIKLSAINSTNDYLKELSGTQHVDNFTIVAAANQTLGRGQMGTQWNVEPGKNLTCSILIKDLLTEVASIFYLNAAVAVSITDALLQFKIPQLSIKWPNDILAGNKKLGGILIENSIRSNGEIYTIAGIGLNVNQQSFPGLPKATSMAVAAGREFDVDAVMILIAEKLKHNVQRLLHHDESHIWNSYLQQLYKKNIPMTFQKNDQKFMGIIKGVSINGNLQVQLEDDTVAEYSLKEVQLLY